MVMPLPVNPQSHTASLHAPTFKILPQADGVLITERYLESKEHGGVNSRAVNALGWTTTALIFAALVGLTVTWFH